MKTLFSVVAMFAFLASAVVSTFAQTQTTTSNTTYIQTSKLVGTKVKSPQGEEIGVVKDVVLDRNTGCMAYTVLSTGGGGAQVSGGGKLVTVPWAVYSPTSNVSELTVTVDRDRIYNAPVFDYARIEEYSRPEYISNVYSYYGVSGGAAVGVGVSGTTTTGTTTTTGANTTTGAATSGAARAGTTASPGAAASPATSRSPMGTASPGRSPSSHGTAATSPRPTRGGRAHETPSTRGGATGASPAERTRGTRETSPAEGTQGTRERREQTTPPSGRGEMGTRSETERAPSEGSSGGEKATGSQRREKSGKHEANTPPERPQE